MKNLCLYLFALLLLTTFCASQTTLTATSISITNHGGWGLSVNVGVNRGDAITLDVACDHDADGECFLGIPALEACSSAAFLPPVLDDGYLPDGAQLVRVHFEYEASCAASTPFVLLKEQSGFRHQRWQVLAPSTGDLFVNAQYWWIGTQVHYGIAIVAAEPL